jgi:hypothetical protein
MLASLALIGYYPQNLKVCVTLPKSPSSAPHFSWQHYHHFLVLNSLLEWKLTRAETESVLSLSLPRGWHGGGNSVWWMRCEPPSPRLCLLCVCHHCPSIVSVKPMFVEWMNGWINEWVIEKLYI